MNAPHIVCEPSILHFGTPVVVISSENEDLAPMSSAFWLRWRCILGLSGAFQDHVEHDPHRTMRSEPAIGGRCRGG